MINVYLVDKTNGRRLTLGSFPVDSHHDANNLARKKHERLFQKFETGAWIVKTHDTVANEEREFPTV